MGPIVLEGVSLHRRGSPVLTEVGLTIHPGERLAVLGGSGSGKTSLLRVMAGLDLPTKGSVQVGGQPLTGRPPGVTMIFQGDSVYDHLDVEGNLAFPLPSGDGSRRRQERVRETAGRFFLTRVLDRSPSTLSEGQRKAVSAARAMARPDVSVVLVDDPLRGADRHLRQRLLESIMEHRALTVVFATREGEDALRWADRVAVLAQGRMAQVDAPLVVYRRPVCLDVAEAMGEVNRIPATVSDGKLHVAGSLLSAEAGRLPEGRRVVIGVRPSALEVAVGETPFSRRLRATVGSVSRVGPVQRVLFGLGRQRGIGFCAEIAASHRIAVGDRVDWWVTAMRLYDPLSGAAL